MFKKIILLFSILILTVSVWAKDIIIYHTTDIHGHYFSRQDKQGKDFGGFARFAGILKDTKQPYLLLDSGDFSSGSYEANISGGKYSIDLMNKTGYTALTIGNHDSDFGDEGLGKMLSGFRGDILAMNVSDFNIPKKQVKPHAIYKVGGIKVGVIGVAMDGSGSGRIKIVNSPSVQDFEDQIQELKEKGSEVIIILAHDSLLSNDEISIDKKSNILENISQTPSLGYVSLVLGGHAHTQALLGQITNMEGKGPWVLEDGPYLESISKTIIHKDKKTGKITVKEPEFIRLEGKEDKKINKYLNTIQAKELDDTIYAKVPVLITKYPSLAQKDRAPAVARMMAEQMYESIKPFEKIDLAAFSLKSTRSDYQPGDLTGRYFAEMAPYEEHSGTFNISGKHLKRAMLESIGYRDGQCFSVYGYSDNVHINFSCNDGKPELRIVKINGKELDIKATYRMAMLTHLPRGFYEGKPFQIMPSDAVDDGTVIKHYKDITVASLLFGIIEKAKETQGKDIPDFIAPSGVQIKEISAKLKIQNKKVK